MVTTRHQAAVSEGRLDPKEANETKKKKRPTSTSKTTKKTAHPPRSQPKSRKKKDDDVTSDGAVGEPETGDKRGAQHVDEKSDKRPTKKMKTEAQADRKDVYQSGTIERGHIYFFYRPRVQLDEAHSIDDIKNFHMLLVPRPPEFATSQSHAKKGAEKPDPSNDSDMKVLKEGADAVPASDDSKSTKKFYRLVTVGKKKLPDPESSDNGETRRKETFWATVTAVGDDLHDLEKGLGGKSYETKTRGTRHESPARLVARGGYAIVNSEGKTPSQRETHLGYHVSHPNPTDLGDVQSSLGIYSASSFVLQVKNPLAPAMNAIQSHSKSADYPAWILNDVFGKSKGKGQARGRESYGLRFASCETPELLDYKGAELLLIAAHDGEEGLERSLGEGRGKALTEKEEQEAMGSVQKVFTEIGLDIDKFPVESLEGTWI